MRISDWSSDVCSSDLIRDAIFAKVGQRAIRQVALRVFRHLHALSLRFHLERQTGGLSRSIERGNNAIETLLRFALFNIRSEKRRVGKGCVSTFRSRWAPLY